jgi:hypothetical protein
LFLGKRNQSSATQSPGLATKRLRHASCDPDAPDIESQKSFVDTGHRDRDLLSRDRRRGVLPYVEASQSALVAAYVFCQPVVTTQKSIEKLTAAAHSAGGLGRRSCDRGGHSLS